MTSNTGGDDHHATHPVKAMLNYAYAVLESQVRIATVAQGLDPAVGYLHTCRPGCAALIYHLMEPLRPQMDRLLLDFVLSHVFAPNDFILRTNGICRLHPQLARQMARLNMNDTAVQDIVAWLVGRLSSMSLIA